MKTIWSAFILFLLFSLCPLFSADYYWVGGAGNWSDISHWATASGGSVQHSQIPTANDNVYFDANSFSSPGQTVTLDIDVIFCKNLDFTGAMEPRILGNTQRSMHLFGSMTLISSMQFDVRGDLRFRSNQQGNVIIWAGHNALRDVYFDNIAGEWTVQDEMTVDSIILLVGGTLDLGGQEVQCYRFDSEFFGARVLNLDGASLSILATTQRSPYNYHQFEYPLSIVSTNMSISARSSKIIFPAADADLNFSGNQNLSIGSVVFTSSSGKSRILRANRSNLSVEFDTLIFRSNGDIFGDNQMSTVVFSGAKSYNLESGSTNQIGDLIAEGSCETSILITSSVPGQSAMIRSSGTKTFDYLTLRDIHLTGATFAVNNAIDLGNNQGWMFDNRMVRTLYWVGNSGDWGDPAHWSLMDGGTGGECPPTAIDDVHFTASSFSSNGQVRLNLEDALCHDFIWDVSHTVSLLGNDNINIFGSVQLDPQLDYTNQGNTHLSGSEDDLTITSNGVAFSHYLFFNGTGTWTLTDRLEVEDSLLFLRGNLNTNDQEIQTDYFLAETDAPRSLILGSSHIYIPDNEHFGGHRWSIDCTNFQMDAGTSLIEIADPFGAFVTLGEGNLKYHDLTFSTNGGFNWIGGALHADVSFNRVYCRSNCDIYGSYSIEELELTPSMSYTIGAGDVITVGELIADGTCEQHINIHCVYGIALFESNSSAIDANFVVLKNIKAMGSAHFTANQSVDLGHNDGWSFDEVPSDERYWVGGEGNWHDRDHWAFTSGGAPGACIPTPKDDVFFDQNSFSGSGQDVWVQDAVAYCRSISWEGSRFQPTFNQYRPLYVNGGVTMISDMQSVLGEIFFVTDSLDQPIDLAGHQIGTTFFMGRGSWILQDSLYNRYRMFLHEGRLNTAGHKVSTTEFDIGANTDELFSHLILDSSLVVVRNTRVERGMYINSRSLTMDAGSSLVQFPNPGALLAFYATNEIGLNNVEFIAASGLSTLRTWSNAETDVFINLLHFYNDGRIDGTYQMDSLIFSAGKTYTLKSGAEQGVNEYLQMIGNNCAQINLRSDVSGAKAGIRMDASVTVVADFVQMQDQHAAGTSTAFAGSHSIDIGNSNSGWIFENPVTYIDDGILGGDQVLCRTNSIELDAYSFTPGETYRWNTGETDRIKEVNSAGIYSVQVMFGNNCVLTDTISVLSYDDFRPDLGPDTILCDGQYLSLDARTGTEDVHYLWQDGTSEPELQVSSEGIYAVSVTLNDCMESDSVSVAYVSAAGIDLGPDLILCEGDPFAIEPQVSSDDVQYQWQDNSTDRILRGNQGGLYWVDVISQGCTARDSIWIEYFLPPVDLLAGDREICFGESEILDASLAVDSVHYLWQDGSTQPVYTAALPGMYSVMLTVGQCVSEHEVYVSQKPSPEFDLGADTTLCLGESLEIDISQAGVDFQWSDGDPNPIKILADEGVYSVTASLDECTTTDTLRLYYHKTPAFDLGPDTVICDDKFLLLSSGTQGARHIWSTGDSTSEITVSKPGMYRLTIDDGLCMSSDSISVSHKSCVYFELYVPNAFTPNEDGINDHFEIFVPPGIDVTAYSMLIFNRWGSLVFESRSVDRSWDGKIDGQIMAPGIYIYSLELSYLDDDGPGRKNTAGEIVLVR